MKAKATVVVVNPATGQRVPLLAGLEVPAWAEPLLEGEPVVLPRYDEMRVADLKSMIRDRNAARADADRLPVEGRKADLIASLTADDRR